MFSSLASFIFGSSTSATTHCEANQNPTRQRGNRVEESPPNVRIDRENSIELTSSTPSVTGDTNSGIQRPQGKRGNKQKRSGKNNPNNKNRKQFEKPTPTPTLTKLLTPSDSFDEDFDEDDWFIVEKEDEADSLPRTDSEEELSIVEVKAKPLAAPPSPAVQPPVPRRRPHLHSHSLYSGPRPQQQRNLLQRTRGGARGIVPTAPTLNPPRSIAGIGIGPVSAADGGVTQSLYVVTPQREARPDGGNGHGSHANGANIAMEESWFVTPPPCFTSIGPIHMETSPFENLLIEHPSMSVYHSIRSAQEATESFVNLDLGVEEPQPQLAPTAPAQAARNSQAVAQRSAAVRVERFNAAQAKQEMLARTTQKVQEKRERQNLCRGAIKRQNKVRDFQSKGNRQRRSDMQHCKVISGANNNRKCCY